MRRYAKPYFPKKEGPVQLKLKAVLDGPRVYIEGNSFTVKEEIRQMGGKWDSTRRVGSKTGAWWLPASEIEKAQKFVNEKTGTSPELEDVEITGLEDLA